MRELNYRIEHLRYHAKQQIAESTMQRRQVYEDDVSHAVGDAIAAYHRMQESRNRAPISRLWSFKSAAGLRN